MSSPSSAPIRTAVIGYGLAGRVFHCPFVDAVPGLELTAIVQRRGDEAAQAYPKSRVFRTSAEAMEDPEIDLIVVATPNDTHVELASAALRAGKHVVVDKPMAPSAVEALTLIELAQKYDRLLAPFHNRRYDGDFLTVQKLINEGTLGRVATVLSHYDRFRPIQRPNTWKEEAGAASGILYDLGPHVVDQALALFGPPARVSASVRADRDKTDIRDAFDITFEYDSPGGQLLRYGCHATMLAAEASPRFRVHGTHGSFIKFGLDPQEAKLLAGSRPPVLGTEAPWLPEPESAWGTLTLATQRTEPVRLERSPYPTVTGDYRLFYANVRDAIRGTAPLAITAEDGYRAIRLLDLAVESSECGSTLPVTFEDASR